MWSKLVKYLNIIFMQVDFTFLLFQPINLVIPSNNTSKSPSIYTSPICMYQLMLVVMHQPGCHGNSSSSAVYIALYYVIMGGIYYYAAARHMEWANSSTILVMITL